jgi:hypothetical protein
MIIAVRVVLEISLAVRFESLVAMLGPINYMSKEWYRFEVLLRYTG